MTQDDIIYFQTEEHGSPVFEVKATFLKDHYFRVEADGVTNDVNLAVYSKVFVFLYVHDFGVNVDKFGNNKANIVSLAIQDQIRHIHIWQGSHHHYFREKLGLDLSEDEESQHKPKFDTSAHPQGTVVAPMSGLVVKVLVKDKTRVEEGQPVLVLEAMKMEVCKSCSLNDGNSSVSSLFIYSGSCN